jgi:hypothetical protein
MQNKEELGHGLACRSFPPHPTKRVLISLTREVLKAAPLLKSDL